MPQLADPQAIAASMRPVLAPNSVAIIGASQDPTRIGGRSLAAYLKGPFRGRVFPVNPRWETVQGIDAYGSLAEVRDEIEFALIALPAPMVLEAVELCAEKGVKAVVIFTAGFSEASAEGEAVQHEITAIASSAKMRVCGPNCLGLFNAETGHVPTFSSFLDAAPPRSGPIGLVTQSGASGTHLLNLARDRGMGVKIWGATGNECDVDVADFIIALALDPDIQVIGCYLEGVRDGDKFIRALDTARRAEKPLIVIKAGRSALGAATANSHTGSLAVSDRVFSDLLRQFGAVGVDSMAEMISALYACRLGVYPSETTARIVTVSGGAGVLMADAADRAGMDLPALPDALSARIKQEIDYAGTRNPVDITAQVMNQPEKIGRILEIVVSDGFRGPIVGYFMNWAREASLRGPLEEALCGFAEDRRGQLLVLSLIAPQEIRAIYEQTGYLVFEDPSEAIAMVGLLARLATTFSDPWPPLGAGNPTGVRESADLPPGPANEFITKRALAAAGIPVPDEVHCSNADDVVRAAGTLGNPVALKISSPDLQHKADVGGVALDLVTPDDVCRAALRMRETVAERAPEARIDGFLVSEMVNGGVETILGAKRDATFGVVGLFGLGGLFTEVFEDVRIFRPPVDLGQARQIVRSIKAFPLLDGARGRSHSDIEALAETIVRFSEFVSVNADRIESLEINPLVVREASRGVVALDALYEPRKDTFQ